MSIQIFIDGKFFAKEKAMVSVFDHGLLYGDGVFEGIRAYNGRVFKLKEHVDRLWESAHTLMLVIPMTKGEMVDAITRTLKKNKLRDAYIRVIVTRGVGDLGLDPRKCPKASTIIIADKIKLYPEALYQKGLEIISVATSRTHPETVNPQIKSLNYLNNILAKIEAVNSGYEEALMLNTHGFVSECTGENIFIVRGNELLTPPAHLGILRGITRACAMEIGASLGLEVREEVLTRHDIYNADEMFLTGTAAEIVPVVKVDNRVIGTGKPGRRTAEIRAAFRDLTQSEGHAF
ncbi:MAG: branched-chain-amino-acid transaminase [Candidatus Omnitrophica bacterium]|jgi:branched-chain amino acid aminotransferase|nr:branched-chain-amino-acid transaminase [Candidatus Omnitrophota bacterium]